MKTATTICVSMLCGAGLILTLQNFSQSHSLELMSKAMANTKTEQVQPGSLSSCEVFFSDNRDQFEEEINDRIGKIKLLQSNVLWSETTKQLGFYALTCY